MKNLIIILMGLSAYSNAKDLEISAKLVNKNLYLTVKTNTKQDIIINIF